MKNLNPNKGVSPREIKEISSEIRNLLRDYSEFIEKVDYLSKIFSKTEIIYRNLNENKIIFELINEDKNEDLYFEKSLEANDLIRKNINMIKETFYHRIAHPLEKMDTAIYKSMNLIEEKFKLEKDFENS